VSRSADRPSFALAAIGTVLVVLGVSLTIWLHPTTEPPDRATTVASVQPQVGHVFVINIENKGFTTAWGSASGAPYLARTLRAKGVLLTHYYGTAHHSLPNYLAQISGQGPNPATQGDCPTYSRFRVSRPAVPPQQLVGSGCVYPRNARTLPGQLSAAGLGWKGYMEDLARPCQHPALGARDPWQRATASEQYATRHNPFVYFSSITRRPAYCASHVVRLHQLRVDLADAATTPALSYITPDLCSDGHDRPCADGRPGGLASVDAWLRIWVPQILRSPAFGQDGMLVITADEADGVPQDSSACCGEGAGPNTRRPGLTGPGGGRIGALVLSPYVRSGATSDRPYNHYSLLATVEDLFGLARIGYARTARAFGADVIDAG
jgi:hypothetical protein